MPRDEVFGRGNVYDFHGMWKIKVDKTNEVKAFI